MSTGNIIQSPSKRERVQRPLSYRQLETLQLCKAIAEETVNTSDAATSMSEKAAEEAAFRMNHADTLQPQNRRMLQQSLGAYRSLHPEWVSIIDKVNAEREAGKATRRVATAPAPAEVAVEQRLEQLEVKEQDAEVAALTAQVSALTAIVTKLCSELGVTA